MQIDAAKTKLFNCAILSINYYQPVQSLMPIDLAFLWPVQLNLLIDLFIDLNSINGKNFSNNYGKNICNISDEVVCKKLLMEKVFVIEEKLETKDLKGFKLLINALWKYKKSTIKKI